MMVLVLFVPWVAGDSCKWNIPWPSTKCYYQQQRGYQCPKPFGWSSSHNLVGNKKNRKKKSDFLLNKWIDSTIQLFFFNWGLVCDLCYRDGIQQRRTSWQDGVLGTNCPIPPGWNYTYRFQVKDQIGSFFYFPSLFFQRAAGGYGGITINNRPVIAIPFDQPDGDIRIFIGDWYNKNHTVCSINPNQYLGILKHYVRILMMKKREFLYFSHRKYRI